MKTLEEWKKQVKNTGIGCTATGAVFLFLGIVLLILLYKTKGEDDDITMPTFIICLAFGFPCAILLGIGINYLVNTEKIAKEKKKADDEKKEKNSGKAEKQ